MPNEIGCLRVLFGASFRGWVPRGTAIVGRDAKFAIASSSLVLPMKASMPAFDMSPTTSCNSLVLARCACKADWRLQRAPLHLNPKEDASVCYTEVLSIISHLNYDLRTQDWESLHPFTVLSSRDCSNTLHSMRGECALLHLNILNGWNHASKAQEGRPEVLTAIGVISVRALPVIKIGSCFG